MTAIFRITAITALSIIIFSIDAWSTHIRAGEITAEIVSCQNLTYRFIITGYTDTGSDVQFGGGEIDFGDGTVETFSTEEIDEKVQLEDEVAINVFIKTHTFPGAGTYTIRFREFNRNADIVNMDNSVNTPFYIETEVVVGDPFIGCNSTPQLTNPPIDRACPGVAFYHNAGAVDPEGDSLSYEFVTPQQDLDVPVTNYVYPDVYDKEVYGALNEDQTEPATFEIDPITGDITWDAPGGEGEYNFAFIIKEWRKISGEWISIGYVTRDMQVLVFDCDNNRPEILTPPDTCVEAGDTLVVDITAEDPDGDDMILTLFGEPFSEYTVSPATYSPNTNPETVQANPATVTFTWATVCDNVREQPYQVRIKAQDDPPSDRGPKLADYDSWNITVVGPAPEGLTGSQGSGNEIELSWDDYSCDNATTMQIWRRVGSNPFEPGYCEVGMPDYAGYELIDVVNISQTNYTDDNFGEGLQWGATYCYRLVAIYPEPDGGESYVSDEICVELDQLSPAMLQVDIEETDTENGIINLAWVPPFDQDETVYPKPYRYELYRSQGSTGGAYSQIGGGSLTDTTYVDSGLNTEDLIYNYFVVAIDNNNVVIDSSNTASSVRLDPESYTGAINLSWDADVPWSNMAINYPYHLIYRDHVTDNIEELVLLDSVNVLAEGMNYLDEGQATGESSLDDKLEYCYYVMTRGSYGSEDLPEPLENRSQRICAQPSDSIPPCTPGDLEVLNLTLDGFCEEYLASRPCDFDDFFNEIAWSVNSTLDSCDDIRSYNIYFSSTGNEEDFTLIDNVTDTFYIHEGLSSFKGCYKISSVDRSGNESELSEKVCNDNCPQYILPNLFSPNGDGYNDTFRAYGAKNSDGDIIEAERYANCPRFVKSVKFKVVNRWGKKVYEFNSEDSENSIYINWDGKTSDGKLLSSGYYYYSAIVTFDVLDPNQQQVELKGWVRIYY